MLGQHLRRLCAGSSIAPTDVSRRISSNFKVKSASSLIIVKQPIASSSSLFFRLSSHAHLPVRWASSSGARERERRERPGEEEEEGEEKSKEQGPQGGFGAYKNAWFDLVKKNLENGRLEEAHRIWEDMREEGVFPSKHIYNVLLHHLKKNQREEDFLDKFEEMQNDGLTPGPLVFSMAIHMTAKLGRVDRTFHLVKEMERIGFTKSEQTFTSLLHACSRVRDFERGLSVINELTKSGKKLTSHVTTEFVNTCSSKGDLDNATQVLNLLEKQASKSLNLLPAYNCLLRKYISLGYTEEAKAWFDKIQKAGHQPDERTYYSLVRGCFSRNIPKFDLAMTFFREMKARNLVPVPDTYNILMQQGHDVGTIDLLGELMKEALAAGCRFSPYTWSTLLSSACARNLPDIVTFFWEEIVRSDNVSAHAMKVYKEYCAAHLPERLPSLNSLVVSTPQPKRKRKRFVSQSNETKNGSQKEQDVG